MARLLESLRPLVSLLLQAKEPVTTAAAATDLAAAAVPGYEVVNCISDAVTDRRLVPLALVHAGILDEAEYKLTPSAPLLLAQTHAMIAMAVEESWDIVLTVPVFLRDAVSHMSREYGGPGVPLDTGRTIRTVAQSAETRLVIAAPYLQTSFASVLAPAVTKLVDAGGSVLVITRALSRSSPERSNSNVAAVRVLRAAAGQARDNVEVCSWDERGIGIHFKVVLADERLAYIGSANLTRGGTAAHAEAGVLLRGTRVRSLSRWLDVVASELNLRSAE